MIKIASLLFFILLFQAASAQDSPPIAFKRFGFRVGANFAHPDFSKGSPPSDVKTDWGAGFVGGFFLVVPISNKIALQPEYLFSQMNSSFTGTDDTFHANYLSLPLFLRFQFNDRFAVLAGPQFDLLIGSELKNSEGTTDYTHKMEERSIAVTAGLECRIWKLAALSVRYMQGFNHIGIDLEDETVEYKYQMIQISGSYRF